MVSEASPLWFFERSITFHTVANANIFLQHLMMNVLGIFSLRRRRKKKEKKEKIEIKMLIINKINKNHYFRSESGLKILTYKIIILI